jgi:hypothetical protein
MLRTTLVFLLGLTHCIKLIAYRNSSKPIGSEEFKDVAFASDDYISLKENELVLPAYATIILKQ